MQKLIAIHNGVARLPEWRLASPVSFELLEGENIAIVGPNGGGFRRSRIPRSPSESAMRF